MRLGDNSGVVVGREISLTFSSFSGERERGAHESAWSQVLSRTVHTNIVNLWILSYLNCMVYAYRVYICL